MELNVLSEMLLIKVKNGEETGLIRTELQDAPVDHLFSNVGTDKQKKAFWINCYNAFYQILRREKNFVKPDIFRRKVIRVAGIDFSLDNIEHGILRRNKIKWSLGYLSDPFAKKQLKKLAVKEMDFRIHFALNCGAKSCPPIAFYTPDQINDQLELATHSFLESETMLNEEKNEIHISRLFKWFQGDFGGRRGIRAIYQRYLDLDLDKMSLIFKPYNWDEDLENFAF